MEPVCKVPPYCSQTTLNCVRNRSRLPTIPGLQIGILLGCWEAGAVFGNMREFAMTYYAGFGITPRQLLQQGIEGMLLLCRTGVIGIPLCIQAALIDNTQGAAVIASGMDALNGFGEQGNDSSIKAYIVVVAALAELSLAAGYQLLHAEGLVASGCCAMDNQQLYIFMFQWLHHTYIQLCTARVPTTEVRIVIIS